MGWEGPSCGRLSPVPLPFAGGVKMTQVWWDGGMPARNIHSLKAESARLWNVRWRYFFCPYKIVCAIHFYERGDFFFFCFGNNCLNTLLLVLWLSRQWSPSLYCGLIMPKRCLASVLYRKQRSLEVWKWNKYSLSKKGFVLCWIFGWISPPPPHIMMISFQVMACISIDWISFKRHSFSAEYCQM